MSAHSQCVVPSVGALALIVALHATATTPTMAQSVERVALVCEGPLLDGEAAQLALRGALAREGTTLIDGPAVTAARAFIDAPAGELDEAHAENLRERLSADRLVLVQTRAMPDGGFAVQVFIFRRAATRSRAFGTSSAEALVTEVARLLATIPVQGAQPSGPTTPMARGPALPGTARPAVDFETPDTPDDGPMFVLFAPLELIFYSSATINADRIDPFLGTQDVSASMTLGIAPAAEYCFSSGFSACLGLGITLRFPSFEIAGSATEVDYNLRLAVRDFPDFDAGKRLGGYALLEVGYWTLSGDSTDGGAPAGGIYLGAKYQILRIVAVTGEVGLYYATAPMLHAPLIRLGAEVDL